MNERIKLLTVLATLVVALSPAPRWNSRHGPAAAQVAPAISSVVAAPMR